MEANHMYIGIDLGGTNIAGGLVDDSGTLLFNYSMPTEAAKGYQHVLEGIANVMATLKQEATNRQGVILGVGIGVPGLADDFSGVVYECVNLLWKSPVTLRADLKELTGYDVHIGNDASVAAVAEFRVGALRQVRNGVLVTLGTGVGGGLIVNGQPFSGSHGVGSEIGHMVVAPGEYRCNCGRMGCLETYASATALIKLSQMALQSGEVSEYFIEKGIESERIEAKDVIEGAKANDPFCLRIFNTMVTHLTIGLINLVTVIDPEIVVLGGGVSKAGHFLIEALEIALEKERIFRAAPKFEIKIAEAGNDAGIIGAAMLCKN